MVNTTHQPNTYLSNEWANGMIGGSDHVIHTVPGKMLSVAG
jgi:hypothetical protein